MALSGNLGRASHISTWRYAMLVAWPLARKTGVAIEPYQSRGSPSTNGTSIHSDLGYSTNATSFSNVLRRCLTNHTHTMTWRPFINFYGLASALRPPRFAPPLDPTRATNINGAATIISCVLHPDLCCQLEVSALGPDRVGESLRQQLVEKQWPTNARGYNCDNTGIVFTVAYIPCHP